MPSMIGSTTANATWPSGCAMTFSTTINTFGVQKISTPMVIGPTQQTTVGSGGHIRRSSMSILTGLLIVMDVGFGVRLTAGPGLVMSRGVGRLTTMVAGCFMGAIGHGVRAVLISMIIVGGDQHSLFSYM